MTCIQTSYNGTVYCTIENGVQVLYLQYID
jgi:hypothetical protein